jgi:phosphate transport system protein
MENRPMADHIVKAFDEDLAAIRNLIAQMGGMAEEQLSRAIDALTRRDPELAGQVIADDKKLDQFELAIEERSVRTIAKRQPMASDLRELMVAIRIASDLERIGDLAKNISKRTTAMTDHIPARVLGGFKRMGLLALEQLKLVLDAYARRDTEKAITVWREDENLDQLYNSVFRELLTYMMEDPRTIGMSTHLLFGAKNIERIGDHATNIAENVYYLVEGRPLVDERPKMDKTSTTTYETPEN